MWLGYIEFDRSPLSINEKPLPFNLYFLQLLEYEEQKI